MGSDRLPGYRNPVNITGDAIRKKGHLIFDPERDKSIVIEISNPLYEPIRIISKDGEFEFEFKPRDIQYLEYVEWLSIKQAFDLDVMMKAGLKFQQYDLANMAKTKENEALMAAIQAGIQGKAYPTKKINEIMNRED